MKLPEHLTVSPFGSLHDTRTPGWANRPLRPLYSRHVRTIKTGADVRACLRAGDWSWPGCYPCFFITSDGATLSFDAVRKNLRSVIWAIRNECSDGWRIIGMESTANCDETIYCDHTGREIS